MTPLAAVALSLLPAFLVLVVTTVLIGAVWHAYRRRQGFDDPMQVGGLAILIVIAFARIEPDMRFGLKAGIVLVRLLLLGVLVAVIGGLVASILRS